VAPWGPSPQCEPAAGRTLGAATGAYLASIDRPESRGTHRQYAATLRRFHQALRSDA